MQITLITPAPPGSKAGNRATAERWERLLNQAGHEVKVVTDYQGEPCDVLIALHAWRSHKAVRRFRDTFPNRPLIVVLTGTDIYDHQHRCPDDTLYSMKQADCLIGLHDLVARDIPEEFSDKLVTVLQSAEQVARRRAGPADGAFQVCVIGHLRREKDSLRAAQAARLLPKTSEITVVNAGKAHTPDWQAAAQAEQAANARFHWLGELDRRASQRLMQNSRVMVISSVMEGGANVVSEACRMGLPILASDISGNRGLLGEDYPGYFPAGDDAALASLMLRAETEPGFLETLTAEVDATAARFTPETEQASLERALALAVQRRS
ncbi:selenoneine biosynthesis selenosugar synthase SenB [Marinobacter qingdaonensis]|uniref:Selenoneine biosynthesis selenosugar synthase SenB n=1 Tax=Marinobacter qingdaonensis TaxID=3108486 RepID=A0ABU5P1S8_9GAMM|nr:selenoneine biosynthesis selenosugar synthase SenB [Marinobacter sp. ASW11-75]MEA1082031.1 selenoneine biosynthesis selenosugar synthase SenB [Marinobacter sp. ASW11-75]